MRISQFKSIELLPSSDGKSAEATGREYRAFPTEALPAVLGDFVREQARALDCDAACVALPVLAAAAGAIGNTRRIRLKAGWEEPSIVWAAVVGEGGTLNSPAYHRTVRGLFRMQKALLTEFRARTATYHRVVMEHHEAMQRLAYREGDPPEIPDRPVLERVICAETDISL
jgi:hypothetical protein